MGIPDGGPIEAIERSMPPDVSFLPPRHDEQEAPKATRRTGRGGAIATGWSVPPDLKERIEKAAAEYGVPETWLVQRLLIEALDEMKPASEFRLTRPKETYDMKHLRWMLRHPIYATKWHLHLGINNVR